MNTIEERIVALEVEVKNLLAKVTDLGQLTEAVIKLGTGIEDLQRRTAKIEQSIEYKNKKIWEWIIGGLIALLIGYAGGKLL